MSCKITVANPVEAADLTNLTVKFARAAVFSSAESVACSGGVSLTNTSTSRTCTATVALDQADISGNSVTLKAGAKGTAAASPPTVQATETTVTMKVAALRVAVTNSTRASVQSGDIPLTITLTNTGPVELTNVTLALPDNVTLGDSSPCAGLIASIGAAAISCPATFTIIPEVAEGEANSIPLTFTASSLVLQAPATTTINAYLGRDALLSITPSIIGTIAKEGGLACISKTLGLLPPPPCVCLLNATGLTPHASASACCCYCPAANALSPSCAACALQATTSRTASLSRTPATSSSRTCRSHPLCHLSMT